MTAETRKHPLFSNDVLDAIIEIARLKGIQLQEEREQAATIAVDELRRLTYAALMRETNLWYEKTYGKKSQRSE